MDELRRRLAEVVAERFGGSQRKASVAAGLNTSAIQQILANPNQVPSLDTLDRIAQTFGWPLEDVIYWALRRPVPARGELEPLRVIAGDLTRLGLDEGMRGSLLTIIEQVVASANRSASNDAGP